MPTECVPHQINFYLIIIKLKKMKKVYFINKYNIILYYKTKENEYFICRM
jgi:hypothetical protein